MSLVGTHEGLIPNRKAVYEQMLSDIASEKLTTKPLLTHKCSFEEAREAFEAYANGDTKRMATLLCWR